VSPPASFRCTLPGLPTEHLVCDGNRHSLLPLDLQPFLLRGRRFVRSYRRRDHVVPFVALRAARAPGTGIDLRMGEPCQYPCRVRSAAAQPYGAWVDFQTVAEDLRRRSRASERLVQRAPVHAAAEGPSRDVQRTVPGRRPPDEGRVHVALFSVDQVPLSLTVTDEVDGGRAHAALRFAKRYGIATSRQAAR